MKVKKVKEFMDANPATINRATHVKEIAHIFLTRRVDSLPVVDSENRLLGVITEKEILTPFIPDYFELLEDIGFISDFGSLESSLMESLEHLLVAEDIMVKDPPVIDQEASLFKALVLTYRYNAKSLPVVGEDKLVGIVSQTDIVKALFFAEE